MCFDGGAIFGVQIVRLITMCDHEWVQNNRVIQHFIPVVGQILGRESAHCYTNRVFWNALLNVEQQARSNNL